MSKTLHPWRTDFSPVAPLPLRLAHFSLRLCLAYPEEVQESSSPFARGHFGDGTLSQLLLPLFDRDQLNRCLQSGAKGEPAAAEEDEPAGAIERCAERGSLDRQLFEYVRKMPRRMRERLARQDGQAPLNPALRVLGQALALTEVEVQVLDFLDAHQSSRALRTLLAFLPQARARDNRARLARLLAVEEAAVHAALRPQASLRSLGLVAYSELNDLEDFLGPTALLRDLLDDSLLVDVDTLLARLVEPAPAAAWPLSDFPHLAAVSAAVGTALGQAARHGEVGVNALLYGPRGPARPPSPRSWRRPWTASCWCARPSDLISPYVGETEQNLARLFREADPRHTVLLLDEVDSFLADRRQARQQWEGTQVNELLQQIERHLASLEGLAPGDLPRPPCRGRSPGSGSAHSSSFGLGLAP